MATKSKTSKQGEKTAMANIQFQFDFGNVSKHMTPGHKRFSRIYQSPRYLWIAPVRDVWRDKVKEHLLEDFASNEKGELRIGLAARLRKMEI